MILKFFNFKIFF